MNRTQTSIVFLIAVLLPVVPILLFACGPYFSSAVFVPAQPADDTGLMEGKTGLVRPTFTRRQLFLVYRNLNGQPLNEFERAALQAAQPAASRPLYESSARWTKTLADALDLRTNWIDGNRMLKDYSYFVNCTAGSFDTASDHLQQLIAKQGGVTAPVRQWVEAQQVVFENCPRDASVPAAPTAAMTPEQRADRRYQIAAAHFYQMKYDTAAQEFEAIAQDASSDWQQYGLLLAARCYLRKATVGPLMGEAQPATRSSEPAQFDKESMRRALRLLEQIASNTSLAAVHDSALRLTSFTQLHLQPEEHAMHLSSSLSKASRDAQFATHLTDYLHLLRDRGADGDALGQWISAVQHPASSSIQRWKTQPDSQPWLVAALIAADAHSSDATALMTAALNVVPTAPAFSTAQYQAARLRFQRGESARVREQIDELLDTRAAHLDSGTLAAFIILRSRTAGSLTDFSKYAAVRPTGFTTAEPGAFEPCSGNSDENEGCASEQITPAAAGMINHMPLTVLIKLASLQSASPTVRRGAALIAFERAVLLNEFARAEAAARLLSAQDQQNSKDLRDFFAAQDDEGRRFAAAVVMLHWPGAAPSLDVSFMRDAGRRELSNFRNNWWGAAITTTRQYTDPLEFLHSDDAPPQFLNDAQRVAARREWAQLSKIESASIWLPRVVINWAKTHRNDGRVPEALHLAVNATHYGGDTRGATPYSKEAFQLLHSRYPGSPWTEKTRYYY
jgi:hypothetical protein